MYTLTFTPTVSDLGYITTAYSIPADKTEYSVGNLRVGVEYLVTITAATAAGQSPSSLPKRFQLGKNDV